MMVHEPGTWVDFQGLRALIESVLIGTGGQVTYRARWLEGRVLHDAYVPAEMIEAEPTGLKIGFV